MAPNLVENCFSCFLIDFNFGREWVLRNCGTESGLDRQEFRVFLDWLQLWTGMGFTQLWDWIQTRSTRVSSVFGLTTALDWNGFYAIMGLNPDLIDKIFECFWTDYSFGSEWVLCNYGTESGFDRQEFRVFSDWLQLFNGMCLRLFDLYRLEMVTQSFCYTASQHFLSYIRFPLPYTLVCVPHHT